MQDAKKSPLDTTSVAVIVPVGDADGTVRDCVRSLLACDPAPDEIILVVDGGQCTVLDELTAPHLRMLQLPKRIGPAKARNLGAAQADSSFLFFVDADVVVPPTIIGRIHQIVAENPSLDAFFGSYDDAPRETNLLSLYKNLFQHHMHQISKKEASTFWTACGVVRRGVFRTLGGFDEGYGRPCIEDIELGYRIRQEGYRIELHKDFQVKHLKRWTALSLFRSDVFCRAVPWTELILRDRNFVDDLNTSIKSRLRVGLIYLGLFALIAAIWAPPAFCAVLVVTPIVLLFDLAFYRFLFHQRGFFFTVGVVPWHCFYYFYSGLAFLYGSVKFQLRRGKRFSSALFRDDIPPGIGERPMLSKRNLE